MRASQDRLRRNASEQRLRSVVEKIVHEILIEAGVLKGPNATHESHVRAHDSEASSKLYT